LERRSKVLLKQRIISAVVILPGILLLIHLGGIFTTMLAAIAMGICLWEFFSMAKTFKLQWLKVFFIVVGIILGIVFSRPYMEPYYLAVILGMLLLVMTLFMLLDQEIDGAISRAALTFMSLFYVAFLLSFVVRLRELEHGNLLVYLSFILVWGNDTCAYFSGRSLGKHKIFPRVSPGKSWEGAIGGLFGSFLGAIFSKYIFLGHLVTITDCVILAVLVSIAGPVGDFCESLIKRSFGVKDSGTILPGHGGLLDRVDAFIFVVPLLYFYFV